MNATSPAVDLAAYFERIGFEGGTTPAPTLDTLRALHLLHPQAIAFENLDPLLGRRVRLDLASLQRKLVAAGRGGYCYEHNLLFRGVLDALGFRTTSLGARVVWGRTDSATPARAHMLLLVDIGGNTYLADVGFGGVTLSAPLAFETGLVQDTPHEAYRLDAVGEEEFLLQVSLDGVFTPLYRFGLEPQHDIDYEVANHYVATHPESIFVHNLLAARLAPAGARFGLFNHVMNAYGAEACERRLDSVQALRDALTNEFAIRLPDAGGDVSAAELDAALARLL
jgi:N-hydroxyarylamine O-acetyltransferase